MNVSPQNTSERPGLLRGLGLWAAVAVVIGDTIGSGIFLVPSAMAAIVGSESLVFAAWVVGGLIVVAFLGAAESLWAKRYGWGSTWRDLFSSLRIQLKVEVWLLLLSVVFPWILLIVFIHAGVRIAGL